MGKKNTSTNPKLLLFCLGQSNKKPISKPEVSKAGCKAVVIFTNSNGHLKLFSQYSPHSGLILDMVTPIMAEQIFVKNWKQIYSCNIRKKKGKNPTQNQVELQHYIHCCICLLIFLL